MKTKKPVKPKVEVLKLQPAVEYQAVDPGAMLAMAVEKGRSLDELKQLMDLQERWLARQARMEYIQAKVDFQKSVPVIYKEKNVGFDHKGDGGGRTEYRFAPLGKIVETIKVAEAEAGLSHDWEITDTDDGVISVTCIISHKGGHIQRGEPMKAKADDSGKKNPIQSKGSTISYLQRYTLIGALGLSTADVDNDGRGSAKGNQDHVAQKIKTKEVYEDIYRKVFEGLVSLEEVKKHYVLNETQEKGLKAAEDIAAKKNHEQK